MKSLQWNCVLTENNRNFTLTPMCLWFHLEHFSYKAFSSSGRGYVWCCESPVTSSSASYYFALCSLLAGLALTNSYQCCSLNAADHGIAVIQGSISCRMIMWQIILQKCFTCTWQSYLQVIKTYFFFFYLENVKMQENIKWGNTAIWDGET